MSEWHAYVAGLFDGEGWVSIARVRAGEYSDYHKIVVGISQRAKHRSVLDEIQAEFGGAVLTVNEQTRIAERWAVQAKWQLQKKSDIVPFLLAIQPYSRIKIEPIRIGLDFIETFEQAPNAARDSLGRVRGRTVSSAQIELRESYRQAMLEANHLGPQRAKVSQLPPLDFQVLPAAQLPSLVGNESTVPRGERHPAAKLTDDRVRAIRSDYATGNYTQAMLAEREGVSLMIINGIVRRTRWGHVEDAPPPT